MCRPPFFLFFFFFHPTKFSRFLLPFVLPFFFCELGRVSRIFNNILRSTYKFLTRTFESAFFLPSRLAFLFCFQTWILFPIFISFISFLKRNFLFVFLLFVCVCVCVFAICLLLWILDARVRSSKLMPFPTEKIYQSTLINGCWIAAIGRSQLSRMSPALHDVIFSNLIII